MRARAWTHRRGLFVALLFAHNSAGGRSGRSTAALYDGPRLGEPEHRPGVADVISAEPSSIVVIRRFPSSPMTCTLRQTPRWGRAGVSISAMTSRWERSSR